MSASCLSLLSILAFPVRTCYLMEKLRCEEEEMEGQEEEDKKEEEGGKNGGEDKEEEEDKKEEEEGEDTHTHRGELQVTKRKTSPLSSIFWGETMTRSLHSPPAAAAREEEEQEKEREEEEQEEEETANRAAAKLVNRQGLCVI
jgi:hypothetical protein